MMDMEEYLGEEFKLLGVDVVVRHLLPSKYVVGAVSGVTFASVEPVDVDAVIELLDEVELEYCLGLPYTHDVPLPLAVHRVLHESGYRGFAVCGCPKSKRIRRIIAKGRLVKSIRRERVYGEAFR